jgi:uncharacterized protein (TIGR03435 family)
MRNKATVFCALALLLATPGFAQVTIGKKPPSPKTTPFQGSPLTEFKPGTSYVLEFWGTWCGSCRVAIPHLNKLALEHRGKGVEFYSISVNDTPADLKAFLSKNKMESNIVIDMNGETSEKYNVHVFPTTVLVGPDGKVAAFTRPESVNSDVLGKLMAGKPLKLPIAGQKTADFDWTRKLPTTATSYVWIEESDTASGGSRFVPGSGAISGDGVFASTLVSLAYDADYQHTDWRAKELEKISYRIAVKAPTKNDELAREMLRPLLKPVFGVEARWEEQEKEVYVITIDPKKTLNLSDPDPNGDGAGSGRINWPSMDSKRMVELFTAFCFGRITVDETNLGDRKFSMKLKWIPGDRASATEAIESLGFQVTKGKRMVKMLVVENAQNLYRTHLPGALVPRCRPSSPSERGYLPVSLFHTQRVPGTSGTGRGTKAKRFKGDGGPGYRLLSARS